MRRLLRTVARITAFRIGLVTGLFFALLHVLQVAGRLDLPLLSRTESTLVDLRFKERVQLDPPRPSGKLLVAAIDEAAIARFGRWPWDRRVIASLVDKLDAEGAAAVAFDM